LEVTEHTQLVGGVVTNLQALETVLRYFLLRLHAQEMQFPKIGDREANETYFTNYLFLGNLVDEYNGTLTETEKKNFAVDRMVVDIRDAIAHGRLLTSTSKEQLPFRLWKFGRPNNGRVPVEFCEQLTAEWLRQTSGMIDRQRQKVVDCFKARRYQGLE
jgi:hypothetical protein